MKLSRIAYELDLVGIVEESLMVYKCTDYEDKYV